VPHSAPPSGPAGRFRRAARVTAAAATLAIATALLVPSAAHGVPAGNTTITGVADATFTSAATAGQHGSATGHNQVAAWGAGWLARQITANGGYLTGFGVPDPTDTAYAVVGLHAAGVGRQASEQAIGYLKTQLGDALAGSDGTDSPGALAYYILAAVSAGADPYRFGGTAPRNDLVGRLLATERGIGPDRGLFGSADPSFDGAFRQGVALTALSAARVPVSRPGLGAAIGWLRGQQCANGLWQGYRADPGVACPAADPATFTGPDTNSTSLAVQGLASYRLYPLRTRVLGSLHAVQSGDGGFGYLAVAGQPSDPDSTALSIQTILAEGGSPADGYWRTAGGTPDSALAGFQLGCSALAADRGAFFYPGSTDPSVLATVQAVPAAAHLTLPLGYSPVSTAVPVQSCSATAGAQPAKAGSQLAEAGSQLAALADRQALTQAARTPMIGTAGPCSGTSGVTVTVDFTAFGGVQQTRCAAGAQTNGITAMQNAGFTPAGTSHYGLAFVCRINNLPAPAQDPCVNTPPPTAYWSYYHALAGASTWSYSSSGASSYKPPLGSIDAWAFGNQATPSKTPAQVRAGS
jgi:hypothetical protein